MQDYLKTLKILKMFIFTAWSTIQKFNSF